MGIRLPSLLPRVGVLAAVLLGASATITFAAAGTLVSAPRTPAAASKTASAAPVTLTVPDVRGQAYVFAKGMLEDAGFAWTVSAGGAGGFATNVVASQSPAPMTKVIDTGAPAITLTLARNPHYAQRGTPDAGSPFPATALELSAPENAAPAAPPTTAKEQAPATKAPSATKTPSAKAKPAVKPKSKYPQHRPPAFVVPGAPKEPLDEMPLPDRARALGAWLATHPQPTNRNVRHWLYQHAWVVTGAKFGWWHGAAALRILIADDRRAERVWGIGSRSQRIARAALAEVEARTR